MHLSSWNLTNLSGKPAWVDQSTWDEAKAARARVDKGLETVSPVLPRAWKHRID